MYGSNQEHLEHVKRIFERKAGVALRAGRPSRCPLRRAAALAAAIACLLTATALAANHFSEGAITRFFQSGAIDVKNNDRALSEAQITTLEDYTAQVNQSVTSQGTTITLKSVTASLSSGNLAAYLVLEIEAPEGAFSGIDLEALTFENADMRYGTAGGMSSGGGGSIRTVLPDELGREHVKTVVFSYLGTGVEFSGGDSPITLTLSNLCCQVPIDRERLEHGARLSDFFHVVAEGSWVFELPSALFREGIELLEGPVTFAGYDYTLTTLELSPFCVAFSLEYPETEGVEADSDQIFSFCGEMRVVMRDGSVIQPMGDGVWGDGGEYGDNMMVLGGAVVGRTALVSSFIFDAPINLGEVDCVQFADGTRIEAGPAR